MTTGISNLKSGITAAVGIICEGIKLAKQAKVMVEEARDLDITEGISLVVQVATEEAPKLMAALKA
jgi:hypothetical protein